MKHHHFMLPLFGCLFRNADDLAHLRAVKIDKHQAFQESSNMHSYFVSAKTGDSVNTCFYRLAAELAGVPLTKAELEATTVRFPILTQRYSIFLSS
jgi:hypothetical protein